MKISEFCRDMAIQINAAGGLPQVRMPFVLSDCWGLCSVFARARDLGLLTIKQKNRLREELYRRQPEHRFGAYFWPINEYAPRVRMLHNLARYFEEYGE